MTDNSRNIIKIVPREDNTGYRILESGLDNNFILAYEFLFLNPPSDPKIDILVRSTSIGSVIRFNSLVSDIQGALLEVSHDRNYTHLRLKELARKEAKVLSGIRGAGYSIEDSTEPGK